MAKGVISFDWVVVVEVVRAFLLYMRWSTRPINYSFERTVAQFMLVEVLAGQSLIKVSDDLQVVDAIKLEFFQFFSQFCDITYIKRANNFGALEFPHLIKY